MVDLVHRVLSYTPFRQAPFIFEYVNMLSEKRAKSNTTVEKILYKLLANSTFGKYVATGLKRMKVKFATTWNDREAIIQKHGYDRTAGDHHVLRESDRYQTEYRGEENGTTVLHRVRYSRHVQTHHLRFLLQCPQDDIR